MEFIVHAKICGKFLPEEPWEIFDCVIKKDPQAASATIHSHSIPRDHILESHVLSKGVNNYIQYPTIPGVKRNFQSEYVIETKVCADRPSRAFERAHSKFLHVINSLSLALKTTNYQLGDTIVDRNSMQHYYDFEMCSVFVSVNGKYLRVDMSEPGLNMRNYFPENGSNSFYEKVLKIVNQTDPVFRKCLWYIQQAGKFQNTGDKEDTAQIIHLIKAIEVICTSDIFEKPEKKHLACKSCNRPLKKCPNCNNLMKKKDLSMKELITYVGKLIDVDPADIELAKNGWDIRNKSDVAHANTSRAYLINPVNLDRAANAFALKYLNFIS